MECCRENCKGSVKEDDAMMWAKRGKGERVEEEEEEEAGGVMSEGKGGGRRSGEEFMKEVMQAVRLSRQPSPRMVRREKLVRLMKRDMERVNTRPGSFVAESLRYHQTLARAYLRFGLQSFPTKEALAMRENRMLRRKMMMLSHED
jgi:hypothetical protein